MTMEPCQRSSVPSSQKEARSTHTATSGCSQYHSTSRSALSSLACATLSPSATRHISQLDCALEYSMPM